MEKTYIKENLQIIIYPHTKCERNITKTREECNYCVHQEKCPCSPNGIVSCIWFTPRDEWKDVTNYYKLINDPDFRWIIQEAQKAGYNFEAGNVIPNELNLIIDNEKQNKRYWITKYYGKYCVTCKDSLNPKDMTAPIHYLQCRSKEDAWAKLVELMRKEE